MPATPALLAFTLAAFVIIVIPGPSVVFLVSQALVHGRRAAVTAVVGNALGEYVQVLAVAFGIGSLAEKSAAAFTAIRLLGGVYVIYLGVRTFMQRRTLAGKFESAGTLNGGGSLRRGFTVGVTNPKTVVFLASILPQFADPRVGSVPEQILVLGLIFGLVALLSDSTWVLAAATLRTWFERKPKRAELLGEAGGVTMIGVGISFLLTRRRP